MSLSVKGKKFKITSGMGLSSKLLILTILFVMLAEILIFLPSIGNFRRNWLAERLSAAQIAALAVEAAPDKMVPEKLRWELLNNAKVYSVAYKHDDVRHLILQSPMPGAIEAHYDLREAGMVQLIIDGIKVYFEPEDKMIRVVGDPEFGTGQFVEILMVQGPLRQAMIKFCLNILALSILISVFTAALVYIALNHLFVRPISRLTHSMMQFSENPENPSFLIEPSGRSDEIGTAEDELLIMQTDLSQMLRQKTHLANLGSAISKISHDLRNMLGIAQLVSDRLTGIDDPTVQRVTPRLVRSIDRAVKLCADTLQYGKAEERTPNLEHFSLRPLIEEILEEQGLPRSTIQGEITIDPSLEIYADHEQLYRVFSNLIRNSVQVIEAKTTNANGTDHICVKASEDQNNIIIDVTDTGPGLPEKAQEYLFEAFKGSVRKGGTGLGLAIAAELVHAQGGEISYLNNSIAGAHFQIKIPTNVIEVGVNDQPAGKN